MRKNTKKIFAVALTLAIATSSINIPTHNVTAEEITSTTVISLASLNAPSKAYLYNFVDASKGYQLCFSDENDYSTTAGVSLSYEVYINNLATPVASVSQSGDYIDASLIDALNLTSGKQYNMSVRTIATWTDGTTTTSSLSDSSTFYYSKGTAGYDTGIPQVYVSTSRTSSTSNINLYTDTSKTKVSSAVTVKDADGSTVIADNFATINVRGNSTALAAKKPYNIKFNSKQNLFGLGKAKKWSLLANIFDKTLVRNWIGLDFQRSLEASRPLGQVYTSGCQTVDLYVDGKYLGNYLLVESVETGSTRVDIDLSYVDENDDISSEATATTTVANGKSYELYDILLELANDVKDVPSRYDEEAYYFSTNYLDEIFSANEPERSNSAYDYIAGSNNKPKWLLNTQSFLNGFESVLSGSYSNAQTQYDLISQFIDIDSFVDFYITSEYFMTKDINFSSTRFYIKNGKLYAGPLWDLDLSSGNSVDHTGYEDFYAQNFKWFQKLMSNSVFASDVKERFKELQPQIKMLYTTGGTVDQAYYTVLESANKTYSVAYNGSDDTGWHLTTNYGAYNSPVIYDTYIAYINEYKTWLENRNNWLISAWNISLEDGDVTTNSSETSTEDITSDSSDYKDCSLNDWVSVGAWSYYAGSWNNSAVQYKGGVTADNFTVNITSTNKSIWGIQIAVPDVSVVSGHQYKYTLNVISNKSGSILSKDDISRQNDDITPISAGSNTITGEFTATSNTAKILLELASGIDAGTTLQITSFSVVDLAEQSPTVETPTTTNTATTEAVDSDKEPIEVLGEDIQCTADNTIVVVWGQNNEQIELGQTYNVYVDDTIIYSSVNCNSYTIENVSAGTHTIRITAVLGTKETAGVTKTITVTGYTSETTQSAEDTTSEESTNPGAEIANGIEMNGYQISTTSKGFRTIYSAEDSINGKSVEEVGLVYALDLYVSDDEVIVGSTNPVVASYAATQAGKSNNNYSSSPTATSYIMTMTFDTFTADELNRGTVVRAYAKLSDGSYIYTNTYHYSIYTVADYIYRNSKMSTFAGHQYLYNNVLSVVNSDYKEVDFNLKNTLV